MAVHVEPPLGLNYRIGNREATGKGFLRATHPGYNDLMNGLIQKILIVACALLTVTSCRTPGKVGNQSTSKEFRRLKKISSEPQEGFRLALIDKIPGPKIRYEATRDFYGWSPGYEEPHLHVTFPELTRAQFDAIKSRYGFGLSRIKYQEGEAYTLADFLMPFMQATLDHDFEPEVQDDYTKIASNCWGTAYEIIRTAAPRPGDPEAAAEQSASVVLFYADTSEMQSALQDEKHSTLVATGKSMEELYEKGAKKGYAMRPGDIVLLLDSDGKMEHAITNIDRDVWFEKVGYSGGSPYRLTTTNDFFHTVSGERTVEWRRYWPGSLPHPAEVFKSIQVLERASNGTTSILDQPRQRPLTRREVRFVFDQLGRASLEDSAYKVYRPDQQAGLNFLPTLSKAPTTPRSAKHLNPLF